MAKRVLTPEELIARKAQQSKTGKSNVARSKSHERQIANLLTEWSGREFRRRRVEGRDVTVIERESTADIISVRDDIHCSIEAKCGAAPTFDALLANPQGSKITEWWHQCCYDVHLVSRCFGRKFYPMMFFRPNPTQNWVAISARMFHGILRPSTTAPIFNSAEYSRVVNGESRALPLVWFPHLLFDTYNVLGEIAFNVVRTKNKDNFQFKPLHLDPMVMCRWHDFAANIDPESFFLRPAVPVPAYTGFDGQGRE